MRDSYRSVWMLPVVSGILVLCLSGSGSPRDKDSGWPQRPVGPGTRSSTFDSLPANAIPWPVWQGVQQTGSVNASFTARGAFGIGFDNEAYRRYPPWPDVSFESPPGSGVQYLYGGGLWIGGIVNEDTLVSVGIDGWQVTKELYPPAGPGGFTSPSVTTFPYPTAFSMRATYTDTINADIRYSFDIVSGHPHTPLHVSVATRSHTFPGNECSDVIVYDMLITNIGETAIQEAYIGFLMDSDVGVTDAFEDATDDVSGLLGDDSIAYVIDEDGELERETPLAKAFAFKLLARSFPFPKHSFNWWCPNGDPALDWGPRKKADTRDFGTGGMGTPEGDANKYHVMSNGETDFDQVLTAWMAENDTTWGPYPSYARYLSTAGRDAKFLYSVGPMELLPDSSVRLIFSTFTGDPVHTDPNNAKQNLGNDTSGYRPFQYLANLNFDGIRRSAAVADSLAGLLLNPMLPVVGVEARVTAADSAAVSWDPWVYSDVTGYEVFLDSIPRSAYVHEGVPPIWYGPASTPYRQVGNEHRCVVTLDNPATAYICGVAHISSSGTGEVSVPVIVKQPIPVTVPRFEDSLLFLRGDQAATLVWHAVVDEPIRQFNIYKFVDTVAARLKYGRHYSTYRNANPADSVWANEQWYYYYALPVFATVPAGETTLIDLTPTDGAVYALTAVDTAGFETSHSHEVVTYQVAEQSNDILLITNSTYTGANFVYADSVISFYDRVLAGYSHDVYSFKDSLAQCANVLPQCMDWRDFMPYRAVIVDDGMRDYILRDWYENSQHGFAKYVLSGGRLIYFGPLTAIDQPELKQTSQPKWYVKEGSFVKQFFGVDSVFFMGLNYYKSATSMPYQDTIVGFYRAASVGPAPSLSYDTTRYVFTPYIENLWPVTSPPSVGVFGHDESAEETHLVLSRYPTQSQVEGLPVGLHKVTPRSDAYLFGFHLYYMNEADARALVRHVLADIPVDVADGDGATLPDRVTLAQNYPNPFNAETIIRFELPRHALVRLEIFNILGQKVQTLVDGLLSAGRHTVAWDGKDAAGDATASGIYLYRLTAGSSVIVRKLLLLR